MARSASPDGGVEGRGAAQHRRILSDVPCKISGQRPDADPPRRKRPPRVDDGGGDVVIYRQPPPPEVVYGPPVGVGIGIGIGGGHYYYGGGERGGVNGPVRRY